MKKLLSSLLCLGALHAAPALAFSAATLDITDLRLDLSATNGATPGIQFDGFGVGYRMTYSVRQGTTGAPAPIVTDQLQSYGGPRLTGPVSAQFGDPAGSVSGRVDAVGSSTAWQLPESVSVASRALTASGHRALFSTDSRFDLTGNPGDPAPSEFRLAPYTTVTLSGTAHYETVLDPDEGSVVQALFVARWYSAGLGADMIQVLHESVRNEAVTIPGERGETPWRISLTNTSGGWADSQLDFFVGTGASTFDIGAPPVPEPAESALTGAGLMALAVWLRQRARSGRSRPQPA